jgi:hypothetical protein
MPYISCLNLPFNAIFVESYEYVLKEDNYRMKALLSYSKFFQYFGLNVPTFVQLYPFNAIKSIKEDNVRFWTLFKKCTMAYSVSFCRNCSTSVVRSPHIFFYSFLPIFLDFLISLIYMVSLFSNFHNYYLFIFLDY